MVGARARSLTRYEQGILRNAQINKFNRSAEFFDDALPLLRRLGCGVGLCWGCGFSGVLVDVTFCFADEDASLRVSIGFESDAHDWI